MTAGPQERHDTSDGCSGRPQALAKLYHPDVLGGGDGGRGGGGGGKFVEAVGAYEVLRDPDTRAGYDARAAARWGGGGGFGGMGFGGAAGSAGYNARAGSAGAGAGAGAAAPDEEEEEEAEEVEEILRRFHRMMGKRGLATAGALAVQRGGQLRGALRQAYLG